MALTRDVTKKSIRVARQQDNKARNESAKQQPEIHIDDFHPLNDGFVHAYHGTWIEQGMKAFVTLDLVERGHWPRGRYVRNAYELRSSFFRLSTRGTMGALQEELGRALSRKLRERMQAEMQVAGWLEIGKTKEGQPIYQHRPPSVAQPGPVPTNDAASIPHVVAESESGITLDELPASHDLVECQDGQHQTKVYVVYGSKEARERGATPAYTRKVSTKAVTFCCIICGTTTTQQCYPGQIPRYCRNEACKREGGRRRVERSREKRKKAQQQARR